MYDIDKKIFKYVINEAEAKIVKTIFTMYTNCSGYSEILTHLNSLGYKTKANKPFSKSSINTILKNEKYRGIYIYNRRKEFDFNRKRRPMEKSESEVIRIEDGIPRIISDDMFYKANHMMTKNRLKSGSCNAKHSYLLSGLIVCGECGSSICGNSRTGSKTNSIYSSYRCAGKVSKKNIKCNCKEIRKEYIENYVLDKLTTTLFNDTNVKELVKMMNEYNEQNKNCIKNELKSYEIKLKNVNNEISNILKLVSSNNVTYDTVQNTIEELEKSKNYIITSIESLEKEYNIEPIGVDKLETLINSSKDFLLSKNIPECRKFIDSYIDSVLVYNESVKIIFNISVMDKPTNEIVKYTTSITRKDLYARYKHLIKKSK